jgi:hypothetical protein
LGGNLQLLQFAAGMLHWLRQPGGCPGWLQTA